MAKRIIQDGIEITMPDNTTLDNWVKRTKPEATQVIVSKRDGSMEVRSVNNLRSLPPDQVNEINTIQHPIKQG